MPAMTNIYGLNVKKERWETNVEEKTRQKKEFPCAILHSFLMKT